MKYPKTKNSIDKYLDESDTFKNEPELNLEEIGIKSIEQITDEKEKYIESFSELLQSIEKIDSKQKNLWKQIYENAVSDRINAYIVWHDLYSKIFGSPTEHGIHGQNISRYLERMSKANDQLLKLSEQISAFATNDNSITLTDDDIYSKLELNHDKQK